MSNPDWLHWLATCPSTNTWAAAHCADLAHGAVVFTPCQTAGRGQWGRSWIAPTGVLTASFVLRSAMPMTAGRSKTIGQLGQLSLLAGLAVIQALAQLAPELSPRLQIKWPNDIWLDGRKLAGILSEATDGVIIVGIGLNRQADFAATTLADRAISLHEVLPTVPSEMVLLETLRSQLLDLAGSLPSPTGQLKVEWVRSINQRDLLRDRTITVQLGNETLVGMGLGIDWLGGYQLRLADGTLKSLRSGQIVSWA